MNDIKLVAIDMDGTLLDDNKQLSIENENAIRACLDAGVIIVPCTGRLWKGIPEAVRKIQGIRYGITVNGATVMDAQEDKVIAHHCLEHELTKEIIDLSRTYECLFDCYANGNGYGEEQFCSRFEYFGIQKSMQSTMLETREWIPDLKVYVEENKIQAEKINNYFRSMEQRKHTYEMLKSRGDIAVTSSIPNNIEINALNATKGHGIKVLAKYLNIPMEQTMGIGDGENDLTMIKDSGIGVAMGNAVQLIKEHANYITEDNNHAGVAKVIGKFVLRGLK